MKTTSAISGWWIVLGLGAALAVPLPAGGEEPAPSIKATETEKPAAEAAKPAAECADCAPNLCDPAPQRSPYAVVDALFLWRDNSSADQTVVFDTNTNQTLLSTGDLGFPMEPGIRARVGWWVDDCRLVEFAYWGVFGGNAQAVVTGDNSLAIPGDLGLASNDFFDADEMRLDYGWKLNSAELNVGCWRCCECCDDDGCGGGVLVRRRAEIYAGFRYIELAEEFNIHATDVQEGISDYNINARNNLFGTQVGARIGRSRGRFGVEAGGSVGLYANVAEQHQWVTDFPPPFFLREPVEGASTGLAFAADLSLVGTFQLNDVWALRGGYTLLWLEGVALAPDQLDFTNTPESGTRLVRDGSVFMHGVTTGLEARW